MGPPLERSHSIVWVHPFATGMPVSSGFGRRTGLRRSCLWLPQGMRNNTQPHHKHHTYIMAPSDLFVCISCSFVDIPGFLCWQGVCVAQGVVMPRHQRREGGQRNSIYMVKCPSHQSNEGKERSRGLKIYDAAIVSFFDCSRWIYIYTWLRGNDNETSALSKEAGHERRRGI